MFNFYVILSFFPSFIILSKKDNSVKPELTPFLYQAMIGVILGDLYISTIYDRDARCRFEQSIKSQEYLIHLFSLFKDYCKQSEPKIITRIDKKNNISYQSIYFVTRALPCFTEFHSLFYSTSRQEKKLYLLT